MSVRKSYAGYLIRRLGTESDLNLGFTDVQGKAVTALNSRHSSGPPSFWGQSDLTREIPQTVALLDHRRLNRVGVANFSWTWTPGRKCTWNPGFT